jgi:Reverse transcriptase (RNA-dependent DNA polymerase)
MLVYVDDIVLTGNNTSLLQYFVQLLDNNFTIKDLGSLHFFLGIEVKANNRGLFLTQSKYIYYILDKAKMQRAKPISSPMATGQALSKFDGENLLESQLFRSVVGAL